MFSTKKLSYLVESAVKWVARVGIICPSCGNDQTRVLDRKYLVTQLRRCGKCGLLFRTPTGDAAKMARFYQQHYEQGFTTDLPSDEKLEEFLATGFRRTEKDYSLYIDILAAAGVKPGMRLLDFGCSWGYGSWQLMKAGFDVSAFEISSRRCQFARERLKIDAYDDIDLIRGDFDVIFSSHVLEHVPAVGPTISRLWSMLREGGRLIAFTPNGSLEYRNEHPRPWHLCWGMVHPNMLDEVFYERAFPSVPFMLASSPYALDFIRTWNLAPGTMSLPRGSSGPELLCIVVKSDANVGPTAAKEPTSEATFPRMATP